MCYGRRRAAGSHLEIEMGNEEIIGNGSVVSGLIVHAPHCFRSQTLELKVRDLLQTTIMFSNLSVTALSELRAEPVQTA